MGMMKAVSVARVIEKAGGPSAVGTAIGKTRQAVAKWLRIPPQHVLTLERLSGIPKEKIRPDIYPPER